MRITSRTYQADTGWGDQALPKCENENTAVLVFGCSQLDIVQDALQTLLEQYGHVQVIGCSSAGEILGDRIYDNSLSIAICEFEKTKIRTALQTIKSSNDSHLAGVEIAKTLQAEDLHGIIVLSDGLNVNGSDLVNGINSILPDSVVVTGGLAGDGDAFTKTWVMCNDMPSDHAIVALGLYGENIEIGYGSQGGWDFFGPERMITKACDNVLYEIDNQPALALYKQYLGERAEGLPATGLLFPLSIRESLSNKNRIVRTILSIDEEKQSMTFAGTMFEGWRAQLMRANFDRLIEGAYDAGRLINFQNTEQDTLLLAISCVGRRLVLGERTEEEVEATLENFSKQTTQIGFYSYGEISPSGIGSCNLHNQTMTLTAIREK